MDNVRISVNCASFVGYKLSLSLNWTLKSGLEAHMKGTLDADFGDFVKVRNAAAGDEYLLHAGYVQACLQSFYDDLLFVV